MTTASLALVNERLGMNLELPDNMKDKIKVGVTSTGTLNIEKISTAAYKKLNGGKIDGYDEVRKFQRILNHRVSAFLKDADIDAKRISVSKGGILSLSFILPKSEKALVDQQVADMEAKLAKLKEKQAKIEAPQAINVESEVTTEE